MRLFEFGRLGSPLSSTLASVAMVVASTSQPAPLLLSGSMSIGNTAAAAASSSMPPNTCRDSREGSSDSAWTGFQT